MGSLIEHRVRVIPVNSDWRLESVHLPAEGSPSGVFYAGLNDAVKRFVGDPIEHVRVFYDFNGGDDFSYLDMFVNELGHLQGLPLNVTATAIYHNNVRVHDPRRAASQVMPVIVGDAVLFEKVVWR